MGVVGSTKVDGLDRLMRKLDKLGGDSMESLKVAGKQAMFNRVRNPTVLKCPVSDGKLRASYAEEGKKDTGIVLTDLSAAEAEVFFGSNVKYAAYVEYGTRPHESSEGHEAFVTSITNWAAKKGIEDVQALIWHIQAHGTKPHPHLRPAWDSGKNKLAPDIAAYMRKEIRKLIA